MNNNTYLTATSPGHVIKKGTTVIVLRKLLIQFYELPTT